MAAHWRDGAMEPIWKFVEQYMSQFDASHDFHHIKRVVALATTILEAEQKVQTEIAYNKDIVLLAALLHDVGDKKYESPGSADANRIHDLLATHGVPSDIASAVQLVATTVSYSSEVKNPGAVTEVLARHPELAIVQDADRLDAIGAIGIGRVFTYGGAKAGERGMRGCLEHLEEKLVRLEGMMKTGTGKQLARERTRRLEVFQGWWKEEWPVDGE
ncbi:HD domain-containing protein [Eremomyces bilateralis CBS 781.70]|uniref:HD domain-containing protein n=1 Tax=Eremomyces bilateralis CBS 781.70 TaxID=1392243 RepID=A0A6G1FZA0_9PEZI|nr:HD domain-containing protein [Eremomyces bilateralis CBS 781.70]KAF1811000.1 HD domain-containing protein [Eremomyces bilateralis CBS 781.70]